MLYLVTIQWDHSSLAPPPSLFYPFHEAPSNNIILTITHAGQHDGTKGAAADRSCAGSNALNDMRNAPASVKALVAGPPLHSFAVSFVTFTCSGPSFLTNNW